MDTRYKFCIEGVACDEYRKILRTTDFKVKSTTKINRVIEHLMQNSDVNKNYVLEIYRRKKGKIWSFVKCIYINDIDDDARFRNYSLVSSTYTLKFVLKPTH